MQELRGKAVLITGGGRRLGRAMALALAEAGADVALTYLGSADAARATAAEITARRVRGMAVSCDVRDPASVRRAVAEVAGTLGGIDVLVNNAAVFETGEFEQLTIEQWDNVFDTNVRGPFLVAREALPALRKTRGRVINMGSLGGVRAWATHAHYCASKAALHMLTAVMAKALAPEVAVNCVAPGMIDVRDDRGRHRHGKRGDDFLSRLASRTPMQRNGSAGDVLAAVLFFATAPHFITGQVLMVDGGLGL